jgi:hypothetical protein
VVEQIEAIGRALIPADLAGHDIVHADLHPGNLLQVDGSTGRSASTGRTTSSSGCNNPGGCSPVPGSNDASGVRLSG